MGIQVYGGHGYIKDNKAEQVFRDVRIAAVWEGTTQIQALDLLGRKTLREKLKPVNEHCATLRAQCMPLLFHSDAQLRGHAWSLLKHALEWQYLTMRVAARAMKDREAVGVAADPYLMFAGHVSLASHWLEMEKVAVEKLASGDGLLERDFYTAKKQTAAFVFENLLPRTRSLAEGVLADSKATMDMNINHFSFDHAR